MSGTITGLNTLGIVIATAGIAGAVILLAKGVIEEQGFDGDSMVTKLGVGMLGGAVLALPIAYMAGGTLLYNTEAVTEEAVGPSETIDKSNVGIVKGTVTDMYKVPTTYLSSADVQITQSEPTVEGSIDAIVENSVNETFTMQIPFITEGTVYAVGNKSGYYPDVQSTTIPGAEVYPSEDLQVDLNLAQIETTPNIKVKDNTGYASLSSGTLTVDNASAVQDFTLSIGVNDSYSAIKNLQALLTRGDSWDNVNGVSPMVSSTPTGISSFTEGDTTLETSVTATMDFKAGTSQAGYIGWGESVEIRFSVDHDTGLSSDELFTIDINDLLGGKDVTGGTGWSGQTITVQTK